MQGTYIHDGYIYFRESLPRLGDREFNRIFSPADIVVCMRCVGAAAAVSGAERVGVSVCVEDVMYKFRTSEKRIGMDKSTAYIYTLAALCATFHTWAAF